MGPRALPLLIALAVPALALGQISAGQLTAAPSEVGQAKCDSTTTADDIVLAWAIDTSKTGRNPTTGDTYLVAVYASGTACPDPTGAPASSASNVVVSGLPATGTSLSTAVTVHALAVAGVVTCPTPWTSASDLTKVLCVYLEDSSNVAQGTAVAASGTFLFQLARPPPPVLDSVDPANEALIANFHPGAATGLDTATSASYRVDVFPFGTTTVVASAAGTTSPIRVDGLTNGTQSTNPPKYTVDVVALSPSPASNESMASNQLGSTPLPFDSFWTAYQNAGGREQGGCGGDAGVVSLAALLPLALRRRRV